MRSIKKLWVVLATGLLVLNGALYAAPGRGPGRYYGHGHGHRSSVSIVIGAPLYRPWYVYPPHRHVIYGPSVVIAPPRPIVVDRTETVIVRDRTPDDTVVVWITNTNGSRTPVTLTRQRDTGYYIGPKGEYYVVLPTDEQLRPLYGLRTKSVKASSLTLWVANANGSKTPVTLTPSNGGFVGPSGEFYTSLPTEEQLKAAYGLPSENQQQDNTIAVWIDSDGKKIPVVFEKEGNDYVGPNGEHYSTLPTKEQLEAVYGKPAVPASNANSITIWIDNAGAKMPVTLQKEGTNYVGPNGEKYSFLPTAEQLRAIYAPADGDQVGVQITKNDGTQTVITLTRKGNEFVGPNGETYSTLPTEEQLKETYGK